MLRPLINALEHHVMSGHKVHADNTPTGMFARGNGKTKTAYLKRFSGILRADGYAGFAQLYATGTTEEAACWAHARRKFYDVYKDWASPLAAEALQRIAALYAIGSEIRGQPSNLRKAVRQSRASPLLEQLHAWLNLTLTQLSKKSALAVRSSMPSIGGGVDALLQ